MPALRLAVLLAACLIATSGERRRRSGPHSPWVGWGADAALSERAPKRRPWRVPQPRWNKMQRIHKPLHLRCSRLLLAGARRSPAFAGRQESPQPRAPPCCLPLPGGVRAACTVDEYITDDGSGCETCSKDGSKCIKCWDNYALSEGECIKVRTGRAWGLHGQGHGDAGTRMSMQASAPNACLPRPSPVPAWDADRSRQPCGTRPPVHSLRARSAPACAVHRARGCWGRALRDLQRRQHIVLRGGLGEG